MPTDAKAIQFICVTAAHHRLGTAGEAACEHFGCAAYCPAGDVGHHEWMPTWTDLGSLAALGYVRDGEDAADECTPEAADDRLVLIRG